jgi:alpha-N-arabinofuranosidase
MKAGIKIYPNEKIGDINPNIYGHFLELVYDCFYGGLWAEMLKVRKFEGDDGEGKRYGIVKPWLPVGRTQNTHFVHDNTIFYSGRQSQKIMSSEGPGHSVGIYQDKLYFEENKTYEVRLNIKQEGVDSPVIVSLEGANEVYASHEINLAETGWTRFTFKMKPSRTDRDGRFVITFKGRGILWIGTVSLMPDDNISGYRKDVVEALRDIKPPNIRWPGGNFVSYYHWEDGIGDSDKRPARPNYAYLEAKGEEWNSREQWEPNDVGIDEFVELCRITGAKPYIAVNAGNGSSQEAANLVEYCNGSNETKFGAKRASNGNSEPYGIELWGIGNESFGNWQGGHVDEETYANRHLDFGCAMRKVDPEIKIVAVGGRFWFYPGWNQALIKIAGEYIDYLSLHSYAKKYRSRMKKDDLNDPDFAREFYYYIVSSPYGIEEQIQLTGKEINSYTPVEDKIKVAFDEWNCWAYKAPCFHVEFAQRDGLYAAGIIHAFRRQNKVMTLANFSMTVNCLSMIRVNQSGMFFNPQYLVFKMYMEHQGPVLLKSEVACDSYPAPEYEKGRSQAIETVPYIDVSVTTDINREKLYLSVINMHESENADCEIIFQNWLPEEQGKAFWLESDNYMTENRFEEPDNIVIKEKELENVSEKLSYDFPSHSVTIFELKKSK